MRLFSAEDERRISEAIASAERQTSGEIVVVVAAQSDGYHYVPPLVGGDRQPARALGADLFHPARSRVDLPHPARRVRRGDGGADAGSPSAWRWFPGPFKRLHAHRRAVEQFLVQNLHTTTGRTGVLLFVSVAERYAEIIADKGINERVAPGTWKDIVDGLTAAIGSGHPADGFVTAIAAIGATLAKHFPPGTRSANELPDHLIILQ